MQHSERIDEVAKALCSLQGSVFDPAKDTQGHGYRYADMEGVVEITRPLLEQNGLSIVQLIGACDEQIVTIENLILHTSGQYIIKAMTMPVNHTVSKAGNKSNVTQDASGAITQARRYSLMAICGMTSIDDDASGIAPPATDARPPSQRTAVVSPLSCANVNGVYDGGSTTGDGKIQTAELHVDKVVALSELIKQAGITNDKVASAFKVDSIRQLSDVQYEAAVKRCNDLIDKEKQ